MCVVSIDVPVALVKAGCWALSVVGNVNCLDRELFKNVNPCTLTKQRQPHNITSHIKR